MSQALQMGIAGYGVWFAGIDGPDAFGAALLKEQKTGAAPMSAEEFAAPRPAAIPARERRRAGLLINLAVEVAHQACEQAGVDKSSVPSVFTSAMGDTAVTDYMCRKLTQPEKLLSPTRFHNSVHNAASGYWTISAENRAPSSFVGGFRESFGAALLEAASQAHAFNAPVLLVAYDIANDTPFQDIQAVDETLGLALVVTDGKENQTRFGSALARYCTDSAPPSKPRSNWLAEFAGKNPLGGALALLERLVFSESGAACKQSLTFAAAPAANLVLEF